MYVPFDQLPSHSRIWVYQADRSFIREEEKIISDTLSDFCAQWSAHGHPLQTSFKIEFSRFVVLSVDESSAGASGCSIDGSVRMLKDLGAQLHLDFFDRTKIAFLMEGEIQILPLTEIGFLFKSGKLSASSITFNNLLADKVDWEKNWKTPAKKTWLSKYFPKSALSF